MQPKQSTNPAQLYSALLDTAAPASDVVKHVTERRRLQTLMEAAQLSLNTAVGLCNNQRALEAHRRYFDAVADLQKPRRDLRNAFLSVCKLFTIETVADVNSRLKNERDAAILSWERHQDLLLQPLLTKDELYRQADEGDYQYTIRYNEKFRQWNELRRRERLGPEFSRLETIVTASRNTGDEAARRMAEADMYDLLLPTLADRIDFIEDDLAVAKEVWRITEEAQLRFKKWWEGNRTGVHTTLESATYPSLLIHAASQTDTALGTLREPPF